MERLLKRLMAWLTGLLGGGLNLMAAGAARPRVQVSSGFQTPAPIAVPSRGLAGRIGSRLCRLINHALYSGMGP